MKTSKKIVALMLALCMLFSLSATIFAAEITYINRFDEMREMWDENGEMQLKAAVALSEGAMSINFIGTDFDRTLLYDKTTSDTRYKVDLDFVVPGVSPYKIEIKDAPITGANSKDGIVSIYFTSVLPFSGTVAKQMIADAETDEVLRSILYIEDGVGVISKDDNTNKPIINGEASKYTYTALSKINLLKYVGYKAAGNNVEGAQLSYHNDSVDVTLKLPKVWVKKSEMPEGTIFIAESHFRNFVSDQWNTVNEHYAVTNGTYLSTHSRGTAGIDLCYGTFKAPYTGEYQVLAMKRDANISSQNQRVITLDISGTEMVFGATHATTDATPKFYWECENNGKTISLTKGETFTVRMLAESGTHGGLYGIALVPANVDVSGILGTTTIEASIDKGEFTTYGMKPLAETDETVTVKVNGLDVVVNKKDAGDFYPNIRTYGKDGQALTAPTVLDALVAAKQATTEDTDYGIDLIPNSLSENKSLVTHPGKPVTPIAPNTYVAAAGGAAWTPTGNSYGGRVFEKAETHFGSSDLKMDIEFHEDGDYYAIVSGSAYTTGRNVQIKVDSTQIPYTASSNKFLELTKTDSGVKYQTSEVPTHIQKGTYTVTVDLTNSIRLQYVAFVKANSAEEAAAFHNSVNTRVKWDNYFDKYDKAVFEDGKLTGSGIIIVNGNYVTENLDQVTLKDGDVIEYILPNKTNFAPVSLNGAFNGNGSIGASDAVTNENGGNAKFVGPVMPTLFDAKEKNALQGTYLNGYVTFIDFDDRSYEIDGVTYYSPGTSGDEGEVRLIFQDFPITASAYNENQKRYELAYKEAGPMAGAKIKKVQDKEYYVSIGMGWLQSPSFDLVDAEGNKLIGSDGKVVTRQRNMHVDFSHLYLTNTNSAAPVKVTATKMGDGVYQLTSNKTLLVKLITVKNGVVSSTNELIDFMDEDGITVTVGDGEIIYVWEGQYVVGPNGATTAKPLCDPLTK